MTKTLLRQEVYQKMFDRFNDSIADVLKTAEALGEVSMNLDGYIIRFKRGKKKLVRRYSHDSNPFFENTRKQSAKNPAKRSPGRKPGRPKGSGKKK